ncbi:unnamed protein product [Urochloa humidicola]
MPTISATKKKPSPECSGAKKSEDFPRVKQRADWNPALERSLVDILHEYKDSGYRGDNGWNSEGWNKMVEEFHVRNNYVSFTKTQIQEKEGQLKRDYKMLKAAKQHSGSSWNEKRDMVEGPPAMWENLMVTFPKIKKFNNNKASFPLFDALRVLYDGHLAEGTYNYTYLEAPQEEELPEQLQDAEDEPQGFDDNVVREVNDEVDDVVTERNEEVLQGRADILSRYEESEAPAVGRSGRRRPAAAPPRNKHEKGEKRPRESANIEAMMERYLEMRNKQAEDETVHQANIEAMMERYLEMSNKMERYLEMRNKQAEDEAAHRANIEGMMERYLEMRNRNEQAEDETPHRARERKARGSETRESEAAQASDFSIKRCISVLNTMEATKEEKAKAYAIFIKSKENREAFICACEVDQESALIWLRSEMA